jgi:hypothetical protein
MDRTITRLPIAAADDSLDRALFEIEAAIAMVVAGAAVTVTLSCFEAAEDAAFTGAALAQMGGLAFRLRRDSPSSVSLVMGPRLRLATGEIHSETES